MAKLNVLKEILQWSEDRPNWQRDALRRLVLTGVLSDADIVNLATQCKANHGLAEAAESVPLAVDHLPEERLAESPVEMKSLTHNGGVNALAQNQTVAFGPGLTVVYGANAAGKSGYTRILKRACRARGAEDILGNVLNGGVPGRPSATIRYSLDKTDHDYIWDDDNPPHRDLSRVSVFDHHCASVYVTEQTDVAYRPLGLDLFDKLSNACEAVRRVLEGERRQMESVVAHLPEVPEGTRAHDLLSRLTSLTKPEDVRTLGTLSDGELARMLELQKSLKDLHTDDPQRTARALELRAGRVKSIEKKIRVCGEVLSDSSIQEAFVAQKHMTEAQRVAESLRHEAFEAQPLPNTGSEAWRALWKAAERYSMEDAYPDEAFPVTEVNSRCVLCQQPLRDDAIDRFRRFHDFLSSESQRERDRTSTEFLQRQNAVRDLNVTDDASAEVLDELHLEEPELAEAARAYLDSAQQRRVAVMNALADASTPAGVVPALPLAPPNLIEHVNSLLNRAAELRGDDHSEKIRLIDSELRELVARRALGQHADAVVSEIERKKRLAAYRECLDETNTNAITRKSTEVTKGAVTEQLTGSFAAELQALNFRHVEVEMVAAGGSRGALYHRLQLRRAPGVSVPRVVSEGEARCLSIASFFAELSTADDRSAILFDDPVSSLDHHWRENVAGRLVAESQSRQVIIFTHDIVFLLSLSDHAERMGVAVKHQYLRRTSHGSGLSEERLPWAAMKVSARVGMLKQMHQEATALSRQGDQAGYEQRASYIYGLLREAWERGVEEVLLNGVIERYRNSVETHRAKHLGDISDEDCKALNDGMSKCSRWLPGHDQAGAENAPFPEPADLEQDILALEGWLAAIRKRRS